MVTDKNDLPEIGSEWIDAGAPVTIIGYGVHIKYDEGDTLYCSPEELDPPPRAWEPFYDAIFDKMKGMDDRDRQELAEALRTIDIDIQDAVQCPECHGRGGTGGADIISDPFEKCWECNGTGKRDG